MAVLLICLHQLHFGFRCASQPPGTGVVSTVLNLVLTSLSRRRFSCLQAIELRARLSLYWSKFQFLLAISAKNGECGLKVVARDIGLGHSFIPGL